MTFKFNFSMNGSDFLLKINTRMVINGTNTTGATFNGNKLNWLANPERDAMLTTISQSINAITIDLKLLLFTGALHAVRFIAL
jgi:hypothetical protein